MPIPTGIQQELEQVESALCTQADRLVALGLSLRTSDLECLRVTAWIVAHLRIFPHDAHFKRIVYVLEYGHSVLDWAMKLERKFLTSFAVANELKTRIDAIDPRVGAEVWVPFRNWNDMRTVKGPIEPLREAYLSLMAIVAKAEDDAVSARVREALRACSGTRVRPAKVKKVSKRSTVDTELRDRMKGPHREIPNEGGTSRKSRQAQRKRAKAAR